MYRVGNDSSLQIMPSVNSSNTATPLSLSTSVSTAVALVAVTTGSRSSTSPLVYVRYQKRISHSSVLLLNEELLICNYFVTPSNREQTLNNILYEARMRVALADRLGAGEKVKKRAEIRMVLNNGIGGVHKAEFRTIVLLVTW